MSVKIMYTSATGNTKDAVDIFAQALNDLGVETQIVDSEDGTDPEEFFEGADAYAIASWSDGDNGEVPGGIIDFFDDLEDYDLSGTPVAIFGTGDTSYAHYCAAVDLFSTRVSLNNAAIIGEPVKVELSPDDEAEQALKDLAHKVAEVIQTAA